jgi:hypothetical protein
MSFKDQLPFVSASQAVQGAYAAISAVQHMTPAEQVAGISLLFAEMSQQLALDPSAITNQASRRATDADTYYAREVKALREYLNKEIR